MSARVKTATATAAGVPSDRFPWLTILCLIVVPFIGHLPAFVTGLSSDPIWTQSNAVLGVGHQLLSGWAFGDPNVGWTNQALGHLAAEDWLHGHIPWWNPDSGIGLPLAGEMQPAAFFLPFILLLHFQNGMFWLECSLQIFAGVATWCLLRRLGFARSSALIGGLLYQFNGSFAWVPNEANLNVLPFLPLLLLGIEVARSAKLGRHAIVLIALAVSGSIFGGFPEASYINGLMAAVWAFGRLLTDPAKLRLAARLAAGLGLGLLLASPLIVAFFDFARQTSVFDTHTPGLKSLHLRALAGIVLPYIYGPLATTLGNLRFMFIAGGPGGYVTALLIPFAILGLLADRDRPLAIILLAWIVLSTMKCFGVPPVMAAMNAIPFVRNLIFHRYSPASWELAFTILAIRGLDEMPGHRWRSTAALLATVLIVAFATALAWPYAAIWHWNAADRAFMTSWFYGATIAELVPLGIAGVLRFRVRGKLRRPLLGLVLIANAMALYALPQLSGVPPGRVDRPAIAFLRHNVGYGRFYTLGPIAPNYGAYFGIQSLNHNYSPIATDWTNYIERHLSSTKLGQHGIVFWPPFAPMQVTAAVNDLIRRGRSYRYLGVNYIVADPGTMLASSITVGAGTGSLRGFPLAAGDSLTVHAIVPPQAAMVPQVTDVGVLAANYGNTASGILALRLCAGGTCAEGEGNLRRSHDNGMFDVRLSHAVAITPGQSYSVTVSHRTGRHAVAIWLWPDAGGTAPLVSGKGQVVTHRAMQLALGNDAGTTGFHRVYHDALMQIWRLDGAAPFYTTTGDACRLSHVALDRVVAQCRAPARLTRRELFMAGWQATNDGHSAPIARQHGIVQSIALHEGANHIRFRFAPPGSSLAWIGFWLAVVIILAVASQPLHASFRIKKVFLPRLSDFPAFFSCATRRGWILHVA